jgi:predicted nucleotidyltransferase
MMPADGVILWNRSCDGEAAVPERDGVIAWNARDPLANRTEKEFEAEARRLLRGRVKAAYFFGSYGTKEFCRDSDVDMILIMRTDTSFTERALAFPDLMDLVPAMDLLVYTPEEFEKLTSEPSPGFWTSVASSLRRFI